MITCLAVGEGHDTCSLAYINFLLSSLQTCLFFLKVMKSEALAVAKQLSAVSWGNVRLSPCTQNSAFHFARAHSSSSFSLSYFTHKFNLQHPAFCKGWRILPQLSSAIDFPSQLTLKRQSHQSSPKAQPALDHAISRRTERKVLRIAQKLS